MVKLLNCIFHLNAQSAILSKLPLSASFEIYYHKQLRIVKCHLQRTLQKTLNCQVGLNVYEKKQWS